MSLIHCSNHLVALPMTWLQALGPYCTTMVLLTHIRMEWHSSQLKVSLKPRIPPLQESLLCMQVNGGALLLGYFSFKAGYSFISLTFSTVWSWASNFNTIISSDNVYSIYTTNAISGYRTTVPVPHYACKYVPSHLLFWVDVPLQSKFYLKL